MSDIPRYDPFAGGSMIEDPDGGLVKYADHLAAMQQQRDEWVASVRDGSARLEGKRVVLRADALDEAIWEFAADPDFCTCGARFNTVVDHHDSCVISAVTKRLRALRDGGEA